MVKNCIRAIFNHEFSAKTHLLFALTNDAPSLALRVLHLRGTPESPLKEASPQGAINRRKWFLKRKMPLFSKKIYKFLDVSL
ncbi:MAG: hypothetical protein IJM03_02035 [Treponema sp.]|nr:hypothetical protein [Treponema sp.]